MRGGKHPLRAVLTREGREKGVAQASRGESFRAARWKLTERGGIETEEIGTHSGAGEHLATAHSFELECIEHVALSDVAWLLLEGVMQKVG